jgi:hypothetical protein
MGPDRFFDAGTFDPSDPLGYIRSFKVAHPALSSEDLAAACGGEAGTAVTPPIVTS